MTDTGRPRVLITKRVVREAVDLLTGHADVDYADVEVGLPHDELVRRLADMDAVMSQLTDHLDAPTLESLPRLKVIANVAAGYDNVDVEAASRLKIAVTNTPGVLTETTADLAFALLMAAARRIAEADRFLRSGRWREWRMDLLCGQDVHGRTLGVVGLGRIGAALCRRARGFGMRLVYHDEHPADEHLERTLELQRVELDTLLSEADFVSLHVPLVQETHHLIGARELGLMKSTAVLVNTSRGPVMDESALAEALASGGIAAAGLDVYEHEPEVDQRLLALENVVLLPHIGSASVETRRRMCLMAAENLVAGFEGRRPPNLVNAGLFDEAGPG